MKLSHQSLCAVLVLAVLVGACKDRKKPLLEAKAEHAQTLATLAAHAPLLKTKGAARVAHMARKRIVDAVGKAAAAEKAKRSTLDEQLAQPSLSLQSSFSHVHAMCGVFAKADDSALGTCAKAVDGLDGDLSMLHEQAEKAGLGAEFPATLAGWITDEAKKKSEPLSRMTSREDKLGLLWADEKATFEALDRACKESIERGKKAPPEAPADDELAELERDEATQDIHRCVALLQYSLAEKMLGACLDRSDASCFHERTCKFVQGVKDAVDPTISVLDTPEKAIAKLDAMPRALRPRAKQFVDRCSGHLR